MCKQPRPSSHFLRFRGTVSWFRVFSIQDKLQNGVDLPQISAFRLCGSCLVQHGSMRFYLGFLHILSSHHACHYYRHPREIAKRRGASANFSLPLMWFQLGSAWFHARLPRNFTTCNIKTHIIATLMVKPPLRSIQIVISQWPEALCERMLESETLRVFVRCWAACAAP